MGHAAPHSGVARRRGAPTPAEEPPRRLATASGSGVAPSASPSAAEGGREELQQRERAKVFAVTLLGNLRPILWIVFALLILARVEGLAVYLSPGDPLLGPEILAAPPDAARWDELMDAWVVLSVDDPSVVYSK